MYAYMWVCLYFYLKPHSLFLLHFSIPKQPDDVTNNDIAKDFRTEKKRAGKAELRVLRVLRIFNYFLSSLLHSGSPHRVSKTHDAVSCDKLC